MNTLHLDQQGSVLHVWLARPAVRNAFNEELIAELGSVFSRVHEGVRAIVISGQGDAFCAGADLAWMQRSVQFSEADNLRDATALAFLFRALDEYPCPTVARINGPALGGALGLIACCDIAVASDTAKFGFTETRLGLAPAVISPFVMRKIGMSWARRYFMTGELFDAKVALQMGLVHDVVDASGLDAAVQQVTSHLVKAGPEAVRAAKVLIREVSRREPDAATEYSVETIAKLRVSSEGQEGLLSFLEKRKPNWQ